MISIFKSLSKRKIEGAVFIRTLISIPEGNFHCIKAKEWHSSKLRNNVQSVHVHKIPFLVGWPDTRTGSKVPLQEALDTAIAQVCSLLMIKHKRKTIMVDQSIELVHYRPPLDTLNDIRPILNVPNFTFNADDYPINEGELEKAKWKLTNNVFDSVNNRTPICQKPEDLKGVDTALFRLAMVYGAAKSPYVYKCPYFFVRYWPSYHFMARIRKSRPALHITFGEPALLNIPGLKSKSVGDMENSIRPFKLSVYRSKFRKLLREKFMEKFCHDGTLMKHWDGLYWFSSQSYPRSKDQLVEFNKHVDLALEHVKRLDKNVLEKRARSMNESIPWSKFKRQLSQL